MPAKLNPDGTTASDWDVQLTGRNVQEIVIANVVQIRDTLAHYFPGNYTVTSNGIANTTILNNSNQMSVHISNTHDQAISLKAVIATKTGGADVRYAVSSSAVSIAAGAKKKITTTDIAELNKPFSRVTFEITCAVLPTLGDVIAIVEVVV